MAAPTGVNEGTPQEPAEPGPGRAQSVEVAPSAVPANAVPPPAPPAEGELAQAGPGGAEPAAADVAEAEPGAAGGQAPDAAAGAQATDAAAGAQAPDAAAGAQAAAAAEDEQAAAAAEDGQAAAAAEDGQAAAAAEDGGERSRDVSRLAIAGIILGIIALVAAAAGVLALVTHGFRPKTVVTYRPAAVFGLRPGECVNTAPNGLSVTVVSCAVPHDAEVFASFSLPASAWPGTAAARQAAGAGCTSRLAGYLNPAFAGVGLTEEYVYPDQAAWLAGERTVVCEVRATNGPLTGSVGKKGSSPAGKEG